MNHSGRRADKRGAQPPEKHSDDAMKRSDAGEALRRRCRGRGAAPDNEKRTVDQHAKRAGHLTARRRRHQRRDNTPRRDHPAQGEALRKTRRPADRTTGDAETGTAQRNGDGGGAQRQRRPRRAERTRHRPRSGQSPGTNNESADEKDNTPGRAQRGRGAQRSTNNKQRAAAKNMPRSSRPPGRGLGPPGPEEHKEEPHRGEHHDGLDDERIGSRQGRGAKPRVLLICRSSCCH